MAMGQGSIKEAAGDMVMPFSIHPVPRYAADGAMKTHLSLALMFCDARSINNKTTTLQNYFAYRKGTWHV